MYCVPLFLFAFKKSAAFFHLRNVRRIKSGDNEDNSDELPMCVYSQLHPCACVKQDSYSEKTTAMLEEYAILKLSPNGQELFGRSWGKE